MLTSLLAQLNAACERWQKALRIQDWTIVLQVVPHEDIPGCYGTYICYVEKKIANIKILDPAHASFDESFGVAYSPYRTLIHELLHVRFQGMVDHEDEHAQMAEEQAIAALAEHLYQQDNAMRNV